MDWANQKSPLARRLAPSLLAIICWSVACMQPARADEAKPTWSSLSASQQQALAPLRADWAAIDSARKQKWLAVASNFERLPASERALIQQRMADWTRLQPAERSSARQHFQESRNHSDEELRARWLEYRALSEAQRQQLANQGQQRQIDQATRLPPVAESALRAKTRELPLASAAPSPEIAPALVQARPGATTTSIAKQPQAAPFQQPGLPRVAATPTFVDPTTLLPRRGAQAAATVGRKASAADSGKESASERATESKAKP